MAEPSTTTNNTPPGRSSSSQGQPPNSQPQPPQNSYNQQHWLIQEAEQRRIAEHQMRHYQQQHPSSQQQQSPVYENSNYLGGMQMPHVPPPSQVGLLKCNLIDDEFELEFSSSRRAELSRAGGHSNFRVERELDIIFDIYFF